MKGYKPITYNWFEQPKKKKKNMMFPEAQMRFNLSPYGDVDKDGRPNWRDCRPYDPFRQGILGDIVTGVKEKAKAVKEKAKVIKDKITPDIDMLSGEQSTLEDFNYKEELPEKKEGIDWITSSDKRKDLTQTELGVGIEPGKSGVSGFISGKVDDIQEDISGRIGDWQEKRAATKEYKQVIKKGGAAEVEELPFYLLVKPQNEEWQLWGPYDKEQVDEEYAAAHKTPGIAHVERTHNPHELKVKNREYIQHKKQVTVDKYKGLAISSYKPREEGYTTFLRAQTSGIRDPTTGRLSLDQTTRRISEGGRRVVEDIGRRPDVQRGVQRMAQGSLGPPMLDVRDGTETIYRIKGGPGTTRGTPPPRNLYKDVRPMRSPMSSAPRAKPLILGSPVQRQQQGRDDMEVFEGEVSYEREPRVVEPEVPFMKRQPTYRSRNVWMTGGQKEKTFKTFIPFKPVKVKFKFVSGPSKTRRRGLL